MNAFGAGFGAGGVIAGLQDALISLDSVSPVFGDISNSLGNLVGFAQSLGSAFQSGGLSSVISMLTGGALDTGIANLKSFFGGDWSGPLAATQTTLAKMAEYLQVVFGAIGNFIQSKIMPFLVNQFGKFSVWLNDNRPLIEQFILVINQLYQVILTGLEWLVPHLLGLWAVIAPDH